MRPGTSCKCLKAIKATMSNGTCGRRKRSHVWLKSSGPMRQPLLKWTPESPPTMKNWSYSHNKTNVSEVVYRSLNLSEEKSHNTNVSNKLTNLSLWNTTSFWEDSPNTKTSLDYWVNKSNAWTKSSKASPTKETNSQSSCNDSAKVSKPSHVKTKTWTEPSPSMKINWPWTGRKFKDFKKVSEGWKVKGNS